MNRWGLMSTVAVALAVGWGVVLTAPGVAYAEMTLPEERLAQQLLAGDVSAARGEFDHLLASLMTGLDQLATQPAETTTALAARANTLRRAVMVLETWEGAELWSRSRGQGAPAATVDRMVAAVDALDVHGREIERLKGNVAAPAAEDHRTRDLRDVGRDVGRLWLQSTAFVRSTSADHRRSQFLAAARHWVATPATVQEFDARFGDDPQKAFNLQPVVPSPRLIRPQTQALAPSPGETRRLLGELQLPEERLYELYLAGSVEVARQGFRELIEARRAAVERSRGEADATLDGLGHYALAVDQLTQAIAFYQLGEVQHATGGQRAPAATLGEVAVPSPIPTQVADDLIQAFGRLSDDADGLVRHRQAVAARFMATDGQREKFLQDWRVRDVESALDRAGRELYRGVLLLRSSSRASARADLLHRAGRLAPVPGSLAEVDRQPIDLRREFGIESAARRGP